LNKSKIILVVALLAFTASFFLTAANNANGARNGSGPRGYLFAFVTLSFPWGELSLKMLDKRPMEFFSTLLSGWINPVFLITVFLLQIKRTTQWGRVLRVVLLLMLPSCWIAFGYWHLRPRYGYFLWTAAIVMALFADLFSERSITGMQNKSL
jgi:hypothetical protein